MNDFKHIITCRCVLERCIDDDLADTSQFELPLNKLHSHYKKIIYRSVRMFNIATTFTSYHFRDPLGAYTLKALVFTSLGTDLFGIRGRPSITKTRIVVTDIL